MPPVNKIASPTWVGLWLQWWQGAAKVSWAGLAAMTALWHAPKRRAATLSALSDAIDCYMRSAAFLAWMHYTGSAMSRAMTLFPPRGGARRSS